MLNKFAHQNCQDRQNQDSQSKIIIKKNGKISLSKSARLEPELIKKNKEINELKTQIFKLKCELQVEKVQNKKIVYLSEQIRKVKQKLIKKVQHKIQNQDNQIAFSSYEMQQYSPNLKKQTKRSVQINNTSKNYLQRQQTENKESISHIFQNFSLINSAQKQSQHNKNQFRDQSQIYQIYSSNQSQKLTEKNNIILSPQMFKKSQTQEMNNQQKSKSKFKKKSQSFFEDKTVKYPFLKDKTHRNKSSFYNEFQLFPDKKNQEQQHFQIQKFSLTNCLQQRKQTSQRDQLRVFSEAKGKLK